MIENVYRDLSE